jgi:outer membrane protein assembly factor BamB
MRSLLLSSSFLLALGASLGMAADWPLFRGNPLQTGVAEAPLAESLTVRWQFKARDSVEGTAAIVGNTVYVGSQSPQAPDDTLYALDLATGQVKWKYKAGPIKAPVAVRDGGVYVGDMDGGFHCVDAATGQKRWVFQLDQEITSGANFVGDNVLFGCGDENLYCLSREGKPVWKFKVPGGPVMGTPAVVGNHTFAAGCDSTLHVIDTATGKDLRGVDLGSQVGASVAVAGDHLYIGTMGNQVLAIDWKKGEIVWTFEEEKRPQAFFASAAVTDSLVIVGSRDKHVHALDRKTGKPVWSFATKGRVDSSPVVAGSRVYAGSQDGHLYVLDLANGGEVAKFKLGNQINASPAVAGESLVIGTEDGTVYCLGPKK